MDKRLIDIKEVSERLGVKVSTIYSWVHQKQIPYIKMGRLVKFDLLELDNWIQGKKVAVEEIPDLV
ncbi:helix-turn-helix transcriptional regulator [Candidatus Omnitrophota bacterium]